jgi:hypothetical protein
VILTAMTTVLGLIPLTFGINIDFIGLLSELKPAFQFGSENTQFWGPMGTAIISGLVFATFLTLVIVPVMYSLFDSVAAGLRQVSFATRESVSTGGIGGDGRGEIGDPAQLGVAETSGNGFGATPEKESAPETESESGSDR